jgi:hypothetical protein
MKYLYTGEFDLGPQISKCLELHSHELGKFNERSVTESHASSRRHTEKIDYTYLNQAIDHLIDFLRVADEYLLEDVKTHCQSELIQLIDENTYQVISEMGELYNAERIVEYCQWYQRRKLNQYGLLDFEHTQSNLSVVSNHERGSCISSTFPQKSKI